eukprot:gnl/Carplike_NY0171/4668_a6343_343.p1 GENE.gnl/Carplike_NY0171/4668_a6343_343~~gnl/Carplike_NY0171/4668_a6343_343.p1  ORF type:complete len:493 (+),score=162.78 gnl/Carplike_NY0171/4668_a6343_343:64-1479(+)
MVTETNVNVFVSYFLKETTNLSTELKGKRAFQKICFPKRKGVNVILGDKLPEDEEVPEGCRMSILKYDNAPKCAATVRFSDSGKGLIVKATEPFSPDKPVSIRYKDSNLQLNDKDIEVEISSFPMLVSSGNNHMLFSLDKMASSSSLADGISSFFKNEKKKTTSSKTLPKTPSKRRSSGNKLEKSDSKKRSTAKKPAKQQDVKEAEFEEEEEGSMPELGTQTQTQGETNAISENTLILLTGFEEEDDTTITESLQVRGYYPEEFDASSVDIVDSETVLIASGISKTLKFLVCVCRGANIVERSWADVLHESTIPPPIEDHLLSSDSCSDSVLSILEKNGINPKEFSLHSLVEKARTKPVFKDHTFIITSSMGSEGAQKTFETLALAAGASKVFVGAEADVIFKGLAKEEEDSQISGEYSVLCSPSVFSLVDSVSESVQKCMFSKDFLIDSCLLQSIVSDYDNVSQGEGEEE